MTAGVVLWLMVWGGMFSGIYNLIPAPSLGRPLEAFQGLRALLPIAAAYLCLLWALATRARYRFSLTAPGLLFAYGALGLAASVVLSPDRLTAVYWGTAYLAPLLVAWFVIDGDDALAACRNLLLINMATVVALMAAVLPQAWRFGFGRATRFEVYQLPLGLGEVRANGVGRYALVVLIMAFVGLVASSAKRRFLWLLLVPPALFLLMQTQSRSALLGLAVASMLFVLVRGLDPRFLVAGPVAAYAIWVSGVTWRARGELSSLVFLTGREATWRRGLERIAESPVLGWGFHADRLLLDAEHMHNSYLHAAIQAGVLGALLFAAAIVAFWAFFWKSGLVRRIRSAAEPDRGHLIQSVLILGFLTARSFFESTAAFYGVDLLLFVPAVCYVYQWAADHPAETP